MGAAESLLGRLNELRNSKTLIVGIGSTLRGDDGLAPLLCEKLKGKTCADVIDTGTVPENYIQQIVKRRPRNLVIVDAVDLGAEPGTIKIVEPVQLDSMIISTHTLSPKVFIDLLGRQIDVNIFFIGVQPAQCGLGQSLSTEATCAVEQLKDIITEIFPPQP
ncbi:MAG TPA: hydrogenase 3 maturation endopeptidase HyCI [Sedimentisphaerales bacterium]|nr:hydrogenase 3 maturation endopeptidase HyCI [Sedimentisphaerales bacterium]